MPGSGKDTQADLLEKKYHLKNISTGKIFRQEMENKTELGLEIDSLMKEGKFVDDNTTCEIIKREIENKEDFILNGFPRNIKQAKWLDSYYQNIDAIIFLDIEEQIARERIKTRSIEIKRPEDATKESLKNRFDIYYKNTFPLVKYYSDRLTIIQGNLPQEMISSIISAIMKTRKPNARYL